ncbi:MAG: hypothetical protein U1C33_00170, partial [Candidatus Cloacimonadaceae bacterium]|nr:hypothetical protein [Candidatus Cloacimonadaceae bacterium]
MKPKCIMHIPWQLAGESVSATEIRPPKMRQAFADIGYDVYYIMGNASTRKAMIHGLKRLLDRGESFDFLYSESSTLPMMLTEDHHLPTHPFVDATLFALARQHNIPIGLYYRDFYWAFPEVRRFGTLKRWYSYIFHQWEIKIYNRSLAAFFFPFEDRDMV